eukprot:SAG31_NODE_30491_length_380_cov_1.060498_2_plen_45_part_01
MAADSIFGLDEYVDPPKLTAQIGTQIDETDAAEYRDADLEDIKAD